MIVPMIFITILMFSGNIKSFVGSFWDATWAEFDDVFFYDLFLVFFLNGNYLFKWKRASTKEYFEKLSHEYITEERKILEKFRIYSLIAVTVFLVAIAVYGANPSEERSENEFVDLTFIFLFVSSFISTITLMSCYYKIHDQDSKKHFKLFVSSGYFRRARKEKDDEEKTESITQGLRWYNLHYKKKKKLHFKEYEKINLKLQDDSRRSESRVLEDLSISLESEDENKALKIIANTMNEKDLDLLEKDSITVVIKGWAMPIATVVSAVGMIIMVLINLQNLIQK